jgi:hypothetical protein
MYSTMKCEHFDAIQLLIIHVTRMAKMRSMNEKYIKTN